MLALRESLETGDFRLTGHGHVNYTAEEVKGELARRLDHYRRVGEILEEKEATLKARQKAVVAARKQLEEMAAAKKTLLTKVEGIEARLKMIEATRATNEFDFDSSALARAKQSVSELEKRLEILARKSEMEGRFSDAGIPVSLEPGRDVVKEIDETFGPADSQAGDAKATAKDKSL
jgi:chromosome segregation ATPase